MEGKKNLQIGKYLGQVGNDGKTIGSDGTVTCNSNTIRVAATENSFIYNLNRGQGTDGILIPANVVEYFKVDEGDIIAVISGSVNISSIY